MRSFVLAVLLCAVPAAAADFALMADPKTTRVESPDRLDETLEGVANSVTVITRREIELRGQPFVSDLLRTLPGLDVVQTGGRGGTTSVFIRGADPAHTLVLVDGVPVNDASNTARFYDFANMTTDQVERIEVLRGPQSVLYGSDAIGGLVSIILKKGEGAPKTSLYGEYGSYESSLFRGEFSGSAPRVDYSASASRFATGSIPSAASDAGNTIRDPYRNATFAGTLGLKPLEALRVDLSARNTYAVFHLAGSGGPGGDDPAYTGTSNETVLSARAALTSLDGRLVQTLTLGESAQTRRFIDDVSYVNPAAYSDSSSYGQTTKAGYQAVVRLAGWNTLTAGVESREERAHQSYTSYSLFGPFVSIQDNRHTFAASAFAEELLKYDDRFFVSLGGREDDDYRYGKVFTYRVAPALLFPATGTKLKASAGTGFKAPTLYQLYSQYGVQTLAPESSAAWDAGLEQDLFDRTATVGATYFRSDVRDLIDFNGATQLYYNVGRVRDEGYELTAQVRPTDALAFKGNFTYTSAVDRTTGAELLRRPRIKFGGDAEVRAGKKLSLDVGATYTGPRADQDFSTFPARRVVLGGYGLWRLSGSYAATTHVKLTARVDNVFDKRYEEVEGYGTMGIAGYGGVELTF